MANKLDRIEKDIEKTKAKIAELQKQLRELEAAKTEQENLQIIQLVRGLNMKPEEFAAFLRGGALQSAPAPQPDFEQEDNAVALTPTRSLCRKPPRHRRRKNPPPAAWSRRAYLLPRRAMQHWWMIFMGISSLSPLPPRRATTFIS